MPPRSTQLRSTQKWLQSAITTSVAPERAALHIAPSATLAPAERVAIYRDLYPARLVSALKTDYPLLFQYLGGEAFTELALLYAQANPSRSFTLNEFGAKLPEFIAKPEFANDLALFERATSEVFHAPEAKPLTAEAIAAVPGDAWESACLEPIPGLRLLALRYPVHRYAEHQQRVPRKPTWLAVYRRNYDVAWLQLTEQSHAVLASLCAGQTLGKALAKSKGPAAKWFQEWSAAGLFTAIQLHSRKKSR